MDRLTASLLNILILMVACIVFSDGIPAILRYFGFDEHDSFHWIDRVILGGFVFYVLLFSGVCITSKRISRKVEEGDEEESS